MSDRLIARETVVPLRSRQQRRTALGALVLFTALLSPFIVCAMWLTIDDDPTMRHAVRLQNDFILRRLNNSQHEITSDQWPTSTSANTRDLALRPDISDIAEIGNLIFCRQLERRTQDVEPGPPLAGAIHWWIIDTQARKLTGPLSHDEFIAQSKRLGLSSAPILTPVKQFMEEKWFPRRRRTSTSPAED